MARKVRDKDLGDRASRTKLKPSGKPYWRILDQGLHLGYRKNKNSGKWVVRLYQKGAKKPYVTDTLPGVADDKADPDNDAVLSFFQAQVKAREWEQRFRRWTAARSFAARPGVIGTGRWVISFRPRPLRETGSINRGSARRSCRFSTRSRAAWSHRAPVTAKTSTYSANSSPSSDALLMIVRITGSGRMTLRDVSAFAIALRPTLHASRLTAMRLSRSAARLSAAIRPTAVRFTVPAASFLASSSRQARNCLASINSTLFWESASER